MSKLPNIPPLLKPVSEALAKSTYAWVREDHPHMPEWDILTDEHRLALAYCLATGLIAGAKLLQEAGDNDKQVPQ